MLPHTPLLKRTTNFLQHDHAHLDTSPIDSVNSSRSPSPPPPPPFEDVSTVEGLHQAREGSLSRLHMTWRDIIQRYNRSFEGLSDEIDLQTGQVVVDQGHLRRVDRRGIGGVDGRSTRWRKRDRVEWVGEEGTGEGWDDRMGQCKRPCTDYDDDNDDDEEEEEEERYGEEEWEEEEDDEYGDDEREDRESEEEEEEEEEEDQEKANHLEMRTKQSYTSHEGKNHTLTLNPMDPDMLQDRLDRWTIWLEATQRISMSSRKEKQEKDQKEEEDMRMGMISPLSRPFQTGQGHLGARTPSRPARSSHATHLGKTTPSRTLPLRCSMGSGLKTPSRITRLHSPHSGSNGALTLREDHAMTSPFQRFTTVTLSGKVMITFSPSPIPLISPSWV
ncbi:MAG: centromere protein Scm3-domain-containing protein [Piptocephalis tieghemiana]|nr:MAG: centromere protein Scm3-domain-containing protein [Piptocephalis tieghemiana]